MDSTPPSPGQAHRAPLPECLGILRQARGTASWYREGHGAIGPDRFRCTPPIAGGAESQAALGLPALAPQLVFLGRVPITHYERANAADGSFSVAC